MSFQAATLETSNRSCKNRILEIDFIKAFCLLAMILVHCYEEFYDGDGSGATSLFVDFFNIVIGASAFMFCMGFTMDLGREKSGADCLKRGGLILLAGLFLNLLRSVLPICSHFFTNDPDIVFQAFITILDIDILPFAGMALLFMGVLKKCGLKPWGIFIVSLVIGGIGTLLRYTDTGIPVLNSFLAFFIGSYAESYFPLCHWFVFVAAGNLYRSYYTRIEDKKKYYIRALPITAVLGAAFALLASNEIGPFQCLGSEIIYYTWMNPCDAIGCIICIIFYMGVMWLLAQLVQKLNPKFRPLSYLANHLTTLYFIHWILLLILEYVFMDGFEIIPWPESDIAIFLYAIGFLALTIVLYELVVKRFKDKLIAHIKSHAALWAALIVLIVAVCVILSVAHGLPEVPSYLNDYTINGVNY